MRAGDERFLVEDPARRPPAFSVVPIDREHGTS